MAKKNGLIGFDPLAWMKDDIQHPERDEDRPPAVSRPAAATSDEPRATTPVAGHPPAARADDLQVTNDRSADAIRLGDVLTIEQVSALHAELGRHLGAGKVVVEAGAVERVDAAGLQLLTALVRAVDGRGMQLEWRAASAALRDAARRLGLSAAMRLG